MATFNLLSPKRKGKKAAYELRTGKRFTNSGKPKKGKNGQHLKVSKEGKAYRAGYLDARKDIGKAAKRSRKRRKKRGLKKGAYNRFGRVNEALIDDLHGPVTFFDPDFDFTPSGRIKGSYNANGRFEPD